MNALVHDVRRAGVSAPALPRDCVCMCALRPLPWSNRTPTGARCQAPYDLNELRRAAYDRLAEGDRDAYLWAMDWIDLCQSAHGGRAVVYE